MAYNDWRSIKLGELISIKHGWPFKSEYMTAYILGKPIVVGIGNFNYSGGFRFESTNLKSYVGNYPKEYNLNPGDVLLVMTCQTTGGEILGVPGRIPSDGRTYLHNQRMGKVLIRDRKRVDIGFLYWLFLSSGFNRHLAATASGTKIVHTSPDRIEAYNFPLPPLPTQRTIASILSSYDDLIENNTRRIAILEEMAQMLYQEWFVKFRFPGSEKKSMVASELGMIPEGWEVVKLGNISTITMGQSPSSQYYNERREGLPFHQGVTNFGTYFPHDRVYCTVDGRVAEADDILFSVRAPVGRINIANKKIVIGRGLAAIKGSNDNQAFVLWQLKTLFKEEDTIGNGSIFKSVTKEDVYNIKMISPLPSVVQQFESVARPILLMIKMLTDKNVNLRRTRDLLLPKLISGEIDVSSWSDENGEEMVAYGGGDVVARRVAEVGRVEPIEQDAGGRRSLWD